MRKNIFLVQIVLFLFLISCRTEDLSTDTLTYNEPTSQKILKTGAYKMEETPLFEDLLRQKVFTNDYFSSSKSSQIIGNEKPVYVVNKENQISYSTIIGKADSSFEVLVYTVGSKESFMVAEYIPENSNVNNTINNFTGTVNYKTIKGTIVGTIKFENGKPLEPSSKNNSKGFCTTTVITVAHSCKSSQQHMPWQQCDLSGASAPYYETFTTTFCEQDHESIYNDWSGGGSYGDPGSLGGGGGGNDLGFAYLLIAHPETRTKFLTLNSDVKLFLENNFYLYEDVEFFKFSVDFFYNNPTTTIQQSINGLLLDILPISQVELYYFHKMNFKIMF